MNWDDYTEITTPADDDTALVHDVSETIVGEKMKRVTWANIKAALKAYFDTLYASLTAPIKETSGPTALTTGAIADGEFLQRVGTTLIGGTPAGGGGASTPPGRLTLESGVPVSTTDQADKTTLYYTPYVGNQIMLYDGVSAWDTITFAELSLNISAFTASKPYDIWIYNNSGTATLDSTVWTDATTRATALAYQDGRLVKSGDATRLYLGTIYMDAASKCQDKLAQRFVWNYYNRANRKLSAFDTTDSWNYTTATWRAANNNTTDGVGRFSFVVGVDENPVSAINTALNYNASVAVRSIGIALDITNAVSATQLQGFLGEAVISFTLASFFKGYTGIGLHFLQKMEFSSANGTTTWYGDGGGYLNNAQIAGMLGEVIG